MMVVGTHMWLGGHWYHSSFRWRVSHDTELRYSPTISIDRWHNGEPNHGKITTQAYISPLPTHYKINILNYRFQRIHFDPPVGVCNERAC